LYAKCTRLPTEDNPTPSFAPKNTPYIVVVKTTVALVAVVAIAIEPSRVIPPVVPAPSTTGPSSFVKALIIL